MLEIQWNFQYQSERLVWWKRYDNSIITKWQENPNILIPKYWGIWIPFCKISFKQTNPIYFPFRTSEHQCIDYRSRDDLQSLFKKQCGPEPKAPCDFHCFPVNVCKMNHRLWQSIEILDPFSVFWVVYTHICDMKRYCLNINGTITWLWMQSTLFLPAFPIKAQKLQENMSHKKNTKQTK